MRLPRPLALLHLFSLGLLASSVNLHAGASNKNGNPFGNGTFFSDSGTFSAVIRAQGQPNFLGVVQVSTVSTPVTSTSVGSSNSGSVSSTGWATVFTPGTNIGTASNPTNIPGTQWSGPAFGVFSGSSLAVTYSLSSYVTSVYTNGNNPVVLTTTNLNGGGEFNATFYNSYPNQNFTGSGYCTVQPSLGSNPTTGTPLLNYTNTVSGTRLQ